MAELLSFLENAPPGSPWRTALDSSPTPPASADSVVTEAEISLNAAHELQLRSLEADLKLAEESGRADQTAVPGTVAKKRQNSKNLKITKKQCCLEPGMI